MGVKAKMISRTVILSYPIFVGQISEKKMELMFCKSFNFKPLVWHINTSVQMFNVLELGIQCLTFVLLVFVTFLGRTYTNTLPSKQTNTYR